jgi:hypothetical protein
MSAFLADPIKAAFVDTKNGGWLGLSVGQCALGMLGHY